MKPSCASSAVSSWPSLCWMEETVRLWRKQSGYGPTGVCLPPCPLCNWYDTLFTQPRQTEPDSFAGRKLKWSVRHTFLPEMTAEFDWIDVSLCHCSQGWSQWQRHYQVFKFYSTGWKIHFLFFVHSSYSYKNTGNKKAVYTEVHFFRIESSMFWI